MILQPDLVTREIFQEALAQLRKKKPGPGIDRLRLDRFHEGLSLQVMHIGPYAEEPATVARMDAFAQVAFNFTFHCAGFPWCQASTVNGWRGTVLYLC